MKPSLADQLSTVRVEPAAATAPVTTGRTRVTAQGLTQWFCPRCFQWVGVRLIPLPNDAYCCMWCAK